MKLMLEPKMPYVNSLVGRRKKRAQTTPCSLRVRLEMGRRTTRGAENNEPRRREDRTKKNGNQRPPREAVASYRFVNESVSLSDYGAQLSCEAQSTAGSAAQPSNGAGGGGPPMNIKLSP